jgi:hypothetical protein
MQAAHLHLIKYSLARNLTISVWDGEEWQVKNSTSYKDIKDAIDSVEESQLRIKDNGAVVGWALIIDQGTPDETVCDYSCTPFMDGWNDVYNVISA